jgi:hypothetical protein
MRSLRVSLSGLLLFSLVSPAVASCLSRRASRALPAAEAPAAVAARPAVVPQAGTPLSAAGSARPESERLIIRTAELRMRVADIDAAEAGLKAKVSELGGYVLSAQRSGADDTAVMQVTFRVPAEKFDEALVAVQALAKVVITKDLKGQDVTEEYVDLDAQLRNLEATRARLLSFLDKAVKVDDALAVQRALTDIQGQIERIAGRIKYLRQSAALSTITVHLVPVTSTRVVSAEGWRPGETGRMAIRGLIGFAQSLADIAIVVGVWAPVWAPVGVLVWWARKRRRAKASP